MIVRSSFAWLVLASLFVGHARAQTAPSIDPAASPVEEAGAPLEEAHVPGPFGDRLHASLLTGLMLPSRVRPSGGPTIELGSGPIVRLETTYDVLPALDVGLAMSFSAHGVRSIEDEDEDGAPTLVFAVGLVADYVIVLGDRVSLALGGQLGVNVVSLATADGDRFGGVGFSLGMRGRTRIRIADGLSVVSELGFLSQLTGYVDSTSGQRETLRQIPTFYLGSGLELTY